MPTPLRSRTQTATEPPPETGDAELVRLAQVTPRAFAALYPRTGPGTLWVAVGVRISQRLA